MPPILLAVFHCSLYREHISSWGGGGLISISAPPRGATGEVMHNIIVFEISIHAPPRGATYRPAPAPLHLDNFNSRPSARGDGKQPKKYSAEALFQFTPLREGRRAGKSQTACGLHFNSRPSARGDPCAAFVLGGVAEFQFTPLREGRPSPCRDKAREDDFNSRPSARGDPRLCRPRHGGRYFNSRPSARGDKPLPL